MAVEKISRRAVLVWLAAVLVYIAAITGRTSFGVAGIDAVARFDIDASRLAVFTSVQVGVYALAQIPTGMLIDRFGARKTLLAGALIMAVGQIILGLTTSYSIAIGARVLIGLGDASAFLSVMRILPLWFPMRRTPIFSQLTAALGQIGQFISAVPFLQLLNASGWTTSFVTLGTSGAVIALAAAVVVRDAPAAEDTEPLAVAAKGEGGASISVHRVASNLKAVLTNVYCWQGVFTHWTNMMPMVVFLLLWGAPAMTLGMGLGIEQVGIVLTLFTIATVIGGPITGVISARLGRRRDLFGLGVAAVQAVLWVLLFFPEEPSDNAFLVVSVITFASALITPVANYAFDTVRENLDRSILVAGTGFANMGGFTASMLATQLLGFMLDYHADGSGYTWGDFRFAWLAVAIVWAIGMVGYVISLGIVRRKTRTIPGDTAQ